MDTATLQAITLGCSKNKVDTEHLLAQLGDRYAILPEEWNGKADVVILNTCGFIGDAKEESIGAILQAVQRKMAGDVGKILVFGCLSQRYMAALREEIPEVRDRIRNMLHCLQVLQCSTCSRTTVIQESVWCFWMRHFRRWIRSEVQSA